MFYIQIVCCMIGLGLGQKVAFPGCGDSYFSGRNIALGQMAEISGVHNKYVASRAVDGNMNTDYDESCAHTDGYQEKPWWRVYFDKPYTITGVIIYHGSDAINGRRLKKFEITAYDEFNRSFVLYKDAKPSQYDKAILPIDLYRGEKFQSLKISVPPNPDYSFDDGKSRLQLCEVQIYTVHLPCHYYTNPLNGVYMLHDGTIATKDWYAACDVIILRCDPGFVPNIPNTQRTCLTNGSWTGKNVYCKKLREEDKDKITSILPIITVVIISGEVAIVVSVAVTLSLTFIKRRRRATTMMYTNQQNIAWCSQQNEHNNNATQQPGIGWV